MTYTVEQFAADLESVRSADMRHLATGIVSAVVGMDEAKAIVARHTDAQVAEFLQAHVKAYAELEPDADRD